MQCLWLWHVEFQKPIYVPFKMNGNNFGNLPISIGKNDTKKYLLPLANRYVVLDPKQVNMDWQRVNSDIEIWPSDSSNCFIIGDISWVMVGHSGCTVGSKKAVMVWLLLTDRCLAVGQMLVAKCLKKKCRADMRFKGKLSHFLLLQCYRVTFLPDTGF